MIVAALAAGALLACGSPLRAQDATNMPPATQHPAGSRSMFSLDRVTKALKLTDDEKTKVAPILDTLNKGLGDLRADTSLSTQDRMAKRKTLLDDATAQLKPILTDDQFARWQKMSTRMHRPAVLPDGGSTNAPAVTPP